MSVDEDKIDSLKTEAFKLFESSDESGAIERAFRGAFDAYDEEMGKLEEEIVKLQRDEGDGEKVEDAIHAFLDVVDRPVGTRKFTVPQTDEAARAIIGLHDAIGRNL